ncbi:MAG: hypothetical protein ACU84J_13510, partial [Gammaproteobacteria bacterium]
MTSSTNDDHALSGRGGTGRSERLLPALNPDYIRVDERSLRDDLTFAIEYAKTLKYFAEDGNEAGDWQGFLNGIDIDEAAAFIHDPSSLPESRALRYRRPHFVLLLAFLKLLAYAREHLNGLTRRHLDFYYRDVLGLRNMPARPDRVNVL